MIQLVVMALLLGTQATGGVVMDGSRLLIGSSSTTIEQFRRSLTSDESWQGFNAFIQITLDQTSVRTESQTLLTYWSEECPSTEQVFRLSLASVNGTHLRGEFVWLNGVYFTTKWLPYEAGQVTTLMMHFNPDSPGGTVDGGRRSSFNMVASGGRFSGEDYHSKYRSEQENSWSSVNVKATSGKGEIRIGGKQILQGTNTLINPFYGVVSFVSFHGAFIKASAGRLSIINDPVEFLKPPFDSSFQLNPYAPQGGYYFLNSSFLSVSGGVTYYTGTAYRTAEADTTRYPVRLDVVGAPPAAPTDASTSAPTTAANNNGTVAPPAAPTDASTSAPTTAANNNGTVSPPRGNSSTALSINGTGFLVMLALSVLSIIIA